VLAGLIVDSWIAGPLTTVASAVHENTRKLLLRRYWQRQIFWTVAMGVAAFLIVEFVPAATHHSNKNWLMAAAFGLYVIGNGLREYGRTVGFIQSDIHSVLRQDLVYVAAVLAGMLSLYLFEVIDVAHVFIVLAASSFLCALFGRHRIMDRTATQASQVDAEDADILHEHQETIRGHGRWAVLGSSLAGCQITVTSIFPVPGWGWLRLPT
jgi:hypothetical protein